MPELVPSGEAAVYLGVSRLKVWKLNKAGELPSYPDPLDGRKRLYKLADLDKLKRKSSTRPPVKG